MSSEPNPVDFNFEGLEPKSVPVAYRGHKYVLREASGGAAAKFRNHQLKSTRLNDGKVTSIDGLADSEALLVSLCLWEPQDGKPDKAVSDILIRSWPNRVVKQLFEWVKENSDLAEDDRAGLEKQLKDLVRRMSKSGKDDREYFSVLLEEAPEELRKQASGEDSSNGGQAKNGRLPTMAGSESPTS